jgi:site-specific DNA recombinase
MPRKNKKLNEVQNQPKELKAAIYCRVSTIEQGQSGLSLDDQKKRCESYCTAKNWQVYSVYSDIASAGSLDRTEFQKLIFDAENKKFNILVALRLDRLSRVPRDFYNFVDKMNYLDISISTVDNDIDTSTPQGRMLVGVLVQFASFEREIGRERTLAAMRERAEQGL